MEAAFYLAKGLARLKQESQVLVGRKPSPKRSGDDRVLSRAQGVDSDMPCLVTLLPVGSL